MRLLHTADWQIGKSFRQFGDKESVVRQARLTAIEALGKLALREGAAHILVAGDIYDSDAPTDRTLLEPLERMRPFTGATWHLLPGNHDPHRPKGVWDRLSDPRTGLPANIRLHLKPEPLALGSDAVLLPAPLTRKSEGGDITDWFDHAPTPTGVMRIGLAHGAVIGFGSDGDASNPVDPRRPERAGLAYLALGDWHRTLRVNPAVWYAGTPEPDRAGSQETGQALIVDIAGPGAPAVVAAHPVGTYRWLTLEARIADSADLDDLETRLRALPNLSATLLRLTLHGSLPLTGRADLERRLSRLEAAFFNLSVDMQGVVARPTQRDLETIDFHGVLRQAADRLQAISSDAERPAEERRRAATALIELFVLASKSEVAPA